MSNKLLIAAIKLYHKREREQNERFCTALDELKLTGTCSSFHNTNADKIWFWGCKRWKRMFPDMEYKLRESHPFQRPPL